MAAVIKNPATHQTNTAIRQKKNANGTGSTKSKPTVTAVSTVAQDQGNTERTRKNEILAVYQTGIKLPEFQPSYK